MIFDIQEEISMMASIQARACDALMRNSSSFVVVIQDEMLFM